MVLTGADWALYSRIGSPASANWLIHHRFPVDYLDALRAEDPEYPELHLQEYVVLSYADVGTRLAAEGKLATDKAIRSFRPNSRMGFSLRINDHYVRVTGPSQIPQGYQWALEAIGAMTPWNNLTLQSGWDKATGFVQAHHHNRTKASESRWPEPSAWDAAGGPAGIVAGMRSESRYRRLRWSQSGTECAKGTTPSLQRH